jgi:peroxiredoxin Q/BCP
MADGIPLPGQAAPAFTVSSTAGDLSLETLLQTGRVVLAFYAEDGTPSCGAEISMLKDASEMVREFGAQIVAVSADSLESHAGFAARLGGVPFPLASDPDLTAASAYDVVDDENGKRARRAVFVIDRDGTVLLSLPHFQPNNVAHMEMIFGALGVEV